MDETRQQLVEARRTLARVNRVCRQAVAYFEGVSVMDERKIKRALSDAVRDAERYLSNN